MRISVTKFRGARSLSTVVGFGRHVPERHYVAAARSLITSAHRQTHQDTRFHASRCALAASRSAAKRRSQCLTAANRRADRPSACISIGFQGEGGGFEAECQGDQHPRCQRDPPGGESQEAGGKGVSCGRALEGTLVTVSLVGWDNPMAGRCRMCVWRGHLACCYAPHLCRWPRSDTSCGLCGHTFRANVFAWKPAAVGISHEGGVGRGMTELAMVVSRGGEGTGGATGEGRRGPHQLTVPPPLPLLAQAQSAHPQGIAPWVWLLNTGCVFVTLADCPCRNSSVRSWMDSLHRRKSKLRSNSSMHPLSMCVGAGVGWAGGTCIGRMLTRVEKACRGGQVGLATCNADC